MRSPDGKHIARIDEVSRVIGLRRGFDTLTVPAFDAGATTAPANAACAVGGDTLLISEVR